MEKRIISLLEKIIPNPDIHAKWLNTLSFMENTGTTKIYKTQSASGRQMVLQHAAEESRHALFFKKLVKRHYGNLCEDYSRKNLLAGWNSFLYFQRLDAMVHLEIQKNMSRQLSGEEKSYIVYLYVTLLIEKRASMVYEIYENLLQHDGKGISLATVIAEETGHMSSTLEQLAKNDPDFSKRMQGFGVKEEKYFLKLLEQLEKSVSGMLSVCT